ncbi:MAG TPA: magnesium transporter [Flavobacteriales bacterium]|nr:magnesium transporter [Flavobacteriales bacterium]
MAFDLTKPVLDRIREGLEGDRAQAVIDDLKELHPADIAEVLDQLRIEEATTLYDALDEELAAEVLLELPEDKREAILETFTGKEIAEEVIDQLDSDDAADVIADLPQDVQDEVMANIEDAEQREEIAELLTYDEHSAGGLMAKELVRVSVDGSMRDCVKELRAHADEIDNVYVIYVVDQHDRLMGTIPLKRLLTTSLFQPVKDVYEPDFISVKADEEAEVAAKLMEKYDLVVLPVLDARGRLLGRITIDDVVDVIREEETEDVQKMAGMEALEDSYMSSTWLEIVKKRVGWLIILFIGESFTATAMSFFEDQIAKAVVLALFVPLIISSGGNTGSQASTLIIRALALGDVTIREWWSVLRREFSVGLILGTVLGIIGFLRVAVWSQFVDVYGEHWLEVGLAVGISLLGVVLWGNLIGSLFPLILKRLGRDPAVSSAPFVATVVDVTGLLIYFGIASILLAGIMI